MSTVKELRELAKSRGLKGYSKMNKAELQTLVQQHMPQAPIAPIAPIAPASGKKLPKVKKADCIANANYEWRVGKGCYEKRQQQAVPVPASAPAGRRVKLSKQPCLADPDRYEWHVGKGCYEKMAAIAAQKKKTDAPIAFDTLPTYIVAYLSKNGLRLSAEEIDELATAIEGKLGSVISYYVSIEKSNEITYSDILERGFLDVRENILASGKAALSGKVNQNMIDFMSAITKEYDWYGKVQFDNDSVLFMIGSINGILDMLIAAAKMTGNVKLWKIISSEPLLKAALEKFRKQKLDVVLHMGFKYEPQPGNLPNPSKAYIDAHISECADAVKDNLEGVIYPLPEVEYIGNRAFKFTCMERSAEYVADQLLNQSYADGPYEGVPWPGTFVVPPQARKGEYDQVGVLYYTKAIINGKTYLPD